MWINELPYCIVMLVKSRRDEAPFWKSIDTGNNKKKIRQSFEDDADSVLEMRHFREREQKKFD